MDLFHRFHDMLKALSGKYSLAYFAMLTCDLFDFVGAVCQTRICFGFDHFDYHKL